VAAGTPEPGPRVLVIGCGALARELVELTSRPGFEQIDLTCLPATLHNRPGGIPALVREKIRAARPGYRDIFVAYADCGTGGRLDSLLGEFPGVQRLPGAHCYEMFAGAAEFAALQEEELGTFYLTDFLTKHFDALVWSGLGLDRHPELRDMYFGAYRRVVLLSQAPDAGLLAQARTAAARLGLELSHRPTGRDGLAAPVLAYVDRRATHYAAAR
jgi:hypothetical protein